MNGWIIPCIFKILFILTLSSNPTPYPQNPYILKTQDNFSNLLRIFPEDLTIYTLKQRPILLKIWNSKTPNITAHLSGSTASHSHPKIPSRVVSLTATWLLTASSCLAGPIWLCPTASTPCTDISSQNRQQGDFGELVRTPWISPSASCAAVVPLGSAWFRIEATQTETPDFAELLCNI